jgi:hypothetical protein
VQAGMWLCWVLIVWWVVLSIWTCCDVCRSACYNSYSDYFLSALSCVLRAAHVPSLFGTGNDTGNPVKLLPHAEPEPKVRAGRAGGAARAFEAC